MARLIAYVDCETTGLKAHRNGLIEFTCALLDVDNNFVEVDRFSSGQMVIPTDVEITDEALKVNGYSREELHLGSMPADVSASFRAFLDKYADHKPFRMAGHNVSMDYEFIREHVFFADSLFQEYFSHRKIDVQAWLGGMWLAGTWTKGTSLKDASLALNVSAEPLPHRSEGGVTAGSEVMRRLFKVIFRDPFNSLSGIQETINDLNKDNAAMLEDVEDLAAIGLMGSEQFHTKAVEEVAQEMGIEMAPKTVAEVKGAVSKSKTPKPKAK